MPQVIRTFTADIICPDDKPSGIPASGIEQVQDSASPYLVNGSWGSQFGETDGFVTLTSLTFMPATCNPPNLTIETCVLPISRWSATAIGDFVPQCDATVCLQLLFQGNATCVALLSFQREPIPSWPAFIFGASARRCKACLIALRASC